MQSFKRFLVALLVGLGVASIFTSAQAFVVRRIQFQGLQRIAQSTALSYMPVKLGQNITPADSNKIIDALFRTGFFSNVQLFHRGNTLVVRVKESSTIGIISIKGNKKITTKKLKPVLKKMGIVEGQVFSSANLDQITEGLKQEYNLLGYHDVKIHTRVVPEPRNRVGIYIKVHEGPIAKVRSIKIIGNHEFSQHRLLKNFALTPSSIFTLLSHHDRYSAVQLNKDLVALKNFYLNYGYLRFRVTSKDVTISRDHKGVNIVIYVDEGPVYKVSGYHITGPYAHDAKIQAMVAQVHTGEVFSRAKIMHVDTLIATYFANRGYAFPQVNVIPSLDNMNNTVSLNFQILPGHRVYVHRVTFSGNNITQDRVLRTQIHQMEGGLFSLKQVNQSKRKLANLPYLRNIQVRPVPVAGKPDQVNVNYHVHEINAGKASVQGGYSDIYGFLYGASITEPNFMGSGKYVSVGFTNSQYSQNYSISYNNPFYTIDGISRGFSVYYNRTSPNSSINMEPYTLDDFGGTVSYGIPLSNYDVFSFGYGYDYITLANIDSITSSTPASAPVLDFVANNPSAFSQFNLSAGWTHSTLNQVVFPTSGTSQNIAITGGVPIIKDSIGYYKITYNGHWYFPLGHGFVVSPEAQLGYGGGYDNGTGSALPFYDNFYAGGISTIPGFESNTLGPMNPNTGNSIGGNVLTVAGVNLIFPNFISNKIRTAITFDAGNVFQTDGALYPGSSFTQNPALQQMSYESFSLKNMRASVGLMVSWYSPLGLITVSVATPVIKKAGDDTEIFGFSFGTSVL